jgi:hypothetical protein
MQKMYKKGFTLGNVPGLAIILVIVAVTLGVGSAILTGVRSGYADNTFAGNATDFGSTGLQTLAGWQPTIALIVAAVVVIGIVSMIKMRE